MKKFAFALGSLFITSSLAATSMAHYFYQNHDHHDLAVRPHTERIAPINYYQELYRDYYRCGSQGCSSENPIEVPRTPSSISFRDARPTDPTEMTREANTYQDRYLVIQEGNYVDRLGYDRTDRNLSVNNYRYTTADSADYSIVMPRGFSQTSAGDYRADGTSLAFRVVGLDNTRCDTKNFWNCGQSQNRSFRSNEALSFVRNVEASYRWNQTEDMSFDYFPTITESFDANVNGRMYTYYTYTALNPADNTMIRIEAVSHGAEKRAASVRAYDLFESFQFN